MNSKPVPWRHSPVMDRARPSGLTRRTLLGAGAAALCAGAAAPGAGIRIGHQKGGTLLLAKARGDVARRLAQRGIEPIDWALFSSGPPLLDALGAGALDIGVTGDTPPIFVQAHGGDLIYVACQQISGASSAILVPKDSPAAALTDLRGKRLAFVKGSGAEALVLAALAQAALSFGDIVPVDLAPADALAAFATGRIDGWAIWDPYFAAAELHQHARILVSGRDLASSAAFYLATRALVRDRPDALCAVLDALRAEAAWGSAHLEEAAALIIQATGLEPAVERATLARSEPAFAVEPLTDALIEHQQSVADGLAAAGVIPRPIRIREAVFSGWRPGA